MESVTKEAGSFVQLSETANFAFNVNSFIILFGFGLFFGDAWNERRRIEMRRTIFFLLFALPTLVFGLEPITLQIGDT